MRSLTPFDSSLVSQTELGRATALVALGRTAEARAAYETALGLRERMLPPGNRGIIAMRAEYGLYLSRLGEFDAARMHLRQAIADCEHDPLPKSDLLEGCLSRLSSVENRAGNLAESFDLAQRAWERASFTQGPASVSALRMRTVVAYRLMDFGDFAGAAVHLRAIVPAMAAGIGERHPQTLNARMSLVESLLLSGDTLGVRDELAAVRSGLVGQESFANSNAAYLGELAADLERAGGRPEVARDTLRAVIAREWAKRDPAGGRLSTLYVALYGLAGDASRRDEVARLGDDVDRLADSTFAPTTAEWPALVAARASAEARVGLREAAWAHALEAERLARERLEYQVRALPDERALQLANQFGATSELLVAVARPEVPDEVATAWDRVVRWRGLVRDEIAGRRPVAAAAADPAVAAAHARWLGAQRHLAQLVVSGAADPADSAGAAHLAEARQDAESAELAYARAARGAVAPREPVDLARVLAALGPDEALVAFAVAGTREGAGTLAAFVARGGDRRPSLLALGPREAIARDVAAWVALLSTPPPAAGAAAAERGARRAGQALRARIWDPVARLVGDARTVHVVGEGPVVDVPWLALPGKGRGYLAEEARTIQVLTAERDLLRRRADADAGRGLLAVGDPDFAAPDASPIPPDVLAEPLALRTRPWPCSGKEPIALPALPAARAEVEELTRSWPADAGDARLLVGADATETDFKRMAPGRAVLHVATHGVVFAADCADSASGAVAGADASTTRGVGGIAPARAGRRDRADGEPAGGRAEGRPRAAQPTVDGPRRLARARRREPSAGRGARRERGAAHGGGSDHARPARRRLGRALGLPVGRRPRLGARGRARHASRLPPGRRANRDRQPLAGGRSLDGRVDDRAVRGPRPGRLRGEGRSRGVPSGAGRPARRRARHAPLLLGRVQRQRRVIGRRRRRVLWTRWLCEPRLRRLPPRALPPPGRSHEFPRVVSPIYCPPCGPPVSQRGLPCPFEQPSWPFLRPLLP